MRTCAGSAGMSSGIPPATSLIAATFMVPEAWTG